MTIHPNQTRVQDAWDAIARGDFTGALAITAADIAMIHGPGAGPYAGPGRGLERLGEMIVYFDEVFAGTFHQDGRCVYADSTCAITLVHETGTTPDGAVFNNRAIWINRLQPNGVADAVWTVDLDDIAMRDFWAARPSTGADAQTPSAAM